MIVSAIKRILAGCKDTNIYNKVNLVFILLIFVTLGAIPYLCTNLKILLAVVWLAFTIFCALSKRGSIYYYSAILPVVVLTDFARFNKVNYIVIFIFLYIYATRTLLRDDVSCLKYLPKSLLVFLMTILVGIFFSTDLVESISTFVLLYLPSALLFMSGYELLSYEKNRKIFEKIMLCLILIVVLHSFYQYSTNSFGFFVGQRDKLSLVEMSSFDKIKFPSFFAASYVASEFYFLLLPFILIYISISKGKTRLLYIALFLLVMTGLVLTQQRTGLMMLLLSLALYPVISLPSINFKKIFKIGSYQILMLGVLLVFAFYTEYGKELSARIIGTITGLVEERPDTIADSGSAFYRILRIIVGWNVFTAYPIFGSGLGTSEKIYPLFGWFIKDYTGGAHNLYVFLLCETGFVGFSGFLFFYLSFVLKTIKSYVAAGNNDKRKIYAGFLLFEVMVLLDGIFSGIMIFPSLLFIFIALAYMNAYDKNLYTYKTL